MTGVQLWNQTDVIWSPDCPVVVKRPEVVSVTGRMAGRCLPCRAVTGFRRGARRAHPSLCGAWPVIGERGFCQMRGGEVCVAAMCRASAPFVLRIAAVLPLVKAARWTLSGPDSVCVCVLLRCARSGLARSDGTAWGKSAVEPVHAVS